VECGEMSSFELADSVAKTGCSHNPVNLSPIVPPSVTGSFTPEAPCDVFLRVPEERSLLPDFDRPSTDSLLFVIPHPLGFEIGPQTIRKTFVSGVSAVSRLARIFQQLSPLKNCQSYRPSGLQDELSFIQASQLVFRRSSVVTRATLFRLIGLLPCMISALDLRRMVRHAGTCRTASSLNFRFQANLDPVSAKLSSSIAAFIPDPGTPAAN